MKKVAFVVLGLTFVAALGTQMDGQTAAQGDGPATQGGPQYVNKVNLVRPPDYREWIFVSSGLGMEYNPVPGTPGRKRCDWPWSGAYISYEGYIMPCCMVSTPDRMNFGRVADRTLVNAWESPEYNRFREQLDSENPPDICKSCSLYWGTF